MWFPSGSGSWFGDKGYASSGILVSVTAVVADLFIEQVEQCCSFACVYFGLLDRMATLVDVVVALYVLRVATVFRRFGMGCLRRTVFDALTDIRLMCCGFFFLRKDEFGSFLLVML